jgi:alpha-tubulin suppressor-like RCC1 family protein
VGCGESASTLRDQRIVDQGIADQAVTSSDAATWMIDADTGCRLDTDCPPGEACVSMLVGELVSQTCVAHDAGVVDLGSADLNIPPDPNLPVLQVSAAGVGDWSHACVLMSNGGIKCWGHNTSGQLGDGTTTDRSTPIDVVSLGGPAVQVSAGSMHTCALLATGAVRCWGYNADGALGDGTTTDRYTPTEVVSLGGKAIAISSSNGGLHSCAVLDTGAVRCWGANGWGQLGNGATVTTPTATPVAVLGLPEAATSISTGGYSSCARLASGAVRCWGFGGWGALGDGTGTNQNTAVPVSLSGTATSVSVGSLSSACALLATGRVSCWGFNSYFELGDGTQQQRNAPVDAATLGASNATFIAAGSCAVLTTGGVRCWGDTWQGPTDVPLGGSATQVAIGDAFACALLSTGGVRCWGTTTYLGDGTSSTSVTPIPVAGLP